MIAITCGPLSFMFFLVYFQFFDEDWIFSFDRTTFIQKSLIVAAERLQFSDFFDKSCLFDFKFSYFSLKHWVFLFKLFFMIFNRLNLGIKFVLFRDFFFDDLLKKCVTDSSSMTLDINYFSLSLSTITISVLPFLRFSSYILLLMVSISFFKLSSLFFYSSDILAKMRFIPSVIALLLFSFIDLLLSKIYSRKFLSPFFSREITSLSLTVLLSLSRSN